jgi:DNA-binding PadR family transcriptional regulator
MKSLPILDLYVLAMLDRGLESLYELQRQAGLSLGASTPALKRLEKSQMVTRSTDRTKGSRVRFEYRLTDAGRREARKGWRLWIDPHQFPNDIDAILRVVDMAHHYGHPPHEIAHLLVGCAELKARDVKSHAMSDTQPASRHRTIYPALRVEVDSARVSAEVKALRRIADQLTRGKATGRSNGAKARGITRKLRS